ncbi:hypothetical protein CNMCM5793_007993 [Aspergillus hiratsukae]|uniref:WD40 repeat-like protein n=1 Tax=Aspergillus hiratsukae TaxID=1194566 RepID=A0A8H6P6G2_9EURO|nr:hypothetical protein CNMCM5793_007993 [Aspergillus hiratsukae]KAF7158513.1 hypothetical protein CNMCM6106_005107 [Aspergillus hiratsukae]
MPDRARRILAYFSREGKAGKPKPTEQVNQHQSSSVTRHPAQKLEPGGESNTPLVYKAAETSSTGDPDPEKVTAAKGQDTENPELLATYERYLLLAKDGQESGELDEPAAEPSMSSRVRQEEIRELAQSKLNAVQQGHLKVIVKGKEIVVKDQIHRILRTIVAAKDFIGTVLNAEPHAAIAWLLTNPVTQTDNATELMAYVSDLMVRCRVIEETLYLPSLENVERNHDIRARLRTKSVALYVQIIKSQMLVTCHYSRAGFFRFWRDVASVDDWKQMLADMIEAKQNIDEDLQALGQSLLGHVDAELSKLQEKADNMIRMLGDITQGLNISKLPCAKYAGFNVLDPTARLSPTTCHENTRVEILDEIVRWGKGADGRCIFWLNGIAGTGKSTVIRTAAEIFHRQGSMGASFFFSRTGELRNQTTALFTTLASQLADSLPELRPYMSKAIDQDKSIGEQLPRNQWERLILEPLLELDKTLLVALTYCLFAQATRLKMIRVRVLITSRPEKTIAEGFRKMSKDLYHVLNLDSDEQSSQTARDISVFLKSQLGVIAVSNGLESGWPGEKQTQTLVQRAGRLFIYAATACRFLDSDFPEEKLPILLATEATVDSPTADLDEMYHLALRQAISESRDSKLLIPLFRRIVGSIILLEERLCPKDLSVLLSIPLRQVRIILDLLRSVLAVPDDDTSPVALFHLSLRDFLLDSARCPDPRIRLEEQSAHGYLLDCCRELMAQRLTKDICHLRRPGTLRSEVKSQRVEECIPYALQYACCFWVTHLANAGVDLQKGDRVYAFLTTHLLHWLETLSLIGNIFEGIASINLLEDLVKAVANPSLRALVYDAKRFVLYMRSVIEEAPLQIYCSGLVFTPRRSVLREISQRNIPAWFENLPRVEDDWSALEQTLQHPESVGQVAVSPDGSLLAVVCFRRGIFLWDTATGQQIMKMDNDAVAVDIAFLDNGSKLAAACYTGAVTLWDTCTGQVLQTQTIGYPGRIQSAAFSSDSPALAYTAVRSSIRLENLDTGQTEQILEVDDDGSIVCFRAMEAGTNERATQYKQLNSCPVSSAYALAYSSEGTKLASGDGDGRVVLWDLTDDGMVDKELSPGHSDVIRHLAFSPDDTKLLSSSEDRTIRVWDVALGETEQILQGHSASISSVAFFPDGSRVASASSDFTARVWNIALKQGKSAQIAVRFVSSVAISLDTNMVAAGFGYDGLELWNVKQGKMQELIEPQQDYVKGTAFSPDGTMLAVGSHDGEITLWSTADGKQRKRLREHQGAADILAFSNDGLRVASANIKVSKRFDDGLIKVVEHGILSRWSKAGIFKQQLYDKIWDLSTSKDEVTFEAQDAFNSLRFSPNSTLLAACYWSEINLFQIATGQLLHQISGHYTSINSIIFLNERIELAVAYDIEDDWVSRNGERLLYLPIDYKPAKVCVQGNVLALGTRNHGVVILEFLPEIDTEISV